MALGISGPPGDDLRSDLRVTFEPKDSGGISVELESKVAPYYGDAIRAQVEDVLTGLGLRHGSVSVVDGGALPFAIAARVEAAALLSGALKAPPAWKRGRAPGGASPKNHLRRSRLYVPGNQPKLFPNAVLHGADGIILDLEDSVHPDDKTGARLLVRNALGTLDWGRTERTVRINQLPLGLDDIQAVVPAGPNMLLVPKVESADQIREVESCIAAANAGGEPIWIMPILESGLGVERAYDIAAACDTVAALTIGLEDYTADLGVEKTTLGSESVWARQRLVNAARAAGVQPIDSVFGDIEDLDALGVYGRNSRAMGYVGMGCVHPRQIPVIHRSFAPSPEAVAKARRIVEAFEAAEAEGKGVVSLGSKMIDPPVVDRARHTLDLARRMGLLEDDPS